MLIKEMPKEVIFNNLTEEQKDYIYRKVLMKYTKEDVLARAIEREVDITEEKAETIAEMYALNGDYDCTFDYWTNIDHLIDEVFQKS